MGKSTITVPLTTITAVMDMVTADTVKSMVDTVTITMGTAMVIADTAMIMVATVMVMASTAMEMADTEEVTATQNIQVQVTVTKVIPRVIQQGLHMFIKATVDGTNYFAQISFNE